MEIPKGVEWSEEMVENKIRNCDNCHCPSNTSCNQMYAIEASTVFKNKMVAQFCQRCLRDFIDDIAMNNSNIKIDKITKLKLSEK